MRLPSQKKVSREDLKDAPDWIDPLIDVQNSFMQTVYQAMNRNMTFDQNIASFIQEFVYVTPSTYPSGVETIRYMSQLKTKAIGLFLLQAYDRSNYTPVTGPVYVPWIENNGTIEISPIQGLAASKSYLIRIMVI